MQTENDITAQRKMAAIYKLARNLGAALDKELVKDWIMLMAEYTAEDVERATLRVIKTYKFKTWPPFAIMQEALDEITNANQQSISDMAQAEWHKLLDDIARIGSYGDPLAMNPTTAFVLRQMGGWDTACSWENKYLDLKRKDFCELWQQAYGKEEALTQGAKGIMELIAEHKPKALQPNRRPMALGAVHAG